MHRKLFTHPFLRIRNRKNSGDVNVKHETVYGLSDSDAPLELDEIKIILSGHIRQTHQKILSGRIKDEKKEEIKIKTLNTLIQLAKTYTRILETEKVQQLDRYVEILKKNYIGR